MCFEKATPDTQKSIISSLSHTRKYITIFRRALFTVFVLVNRSVDNIWYYEPINVYEQESLFIFIIIVLCGKSLLILRTLGLKMIYNFQTWEVLPARVLEHVIIKYDSIILLFVLITVVFIFYFWQIEKCKKFLTKLHKSST